MNAQDDAIAYVKAHQREIIDSFCDLGKYPASKNPFTIFMAGSPGAGKTEFSKAFLKQLEIKSFAQKVIRLDTDELRELLPQYTGSNSDQVQKASTILFDKVFDRIHHNCQNVLVDTTFASPRAIENVSRAINRGRKVGIMYLYQNPIIAWEYTKKREKLEGRTVPKKIFISAYFNAQKNVNSVKAQYGDQIVLDLFEKDENNDYGKKARFNIRSLDKYIKEAYTFSQLEKVLPEEI